MLFSLFLVEMTQEHASRSRTTYFGNQIEHERITTINTGRTFVASQHIQPSNPHIVQLSSEHRRRLFIAILFLARVAVQMQSLGMKRMHFEIHRLPILLKFINKSWE